MPPRTALRNNGLAIMFAAAAVDSTAGLFSRLLDSDGFTTASGRGFFAFLFLAAVLLLRDGRGTLASLAKVGSAGAAFVLLNASGMVMTVLSLQSTAVANFFMIFATAPFAAAVAGRLVLGERLDGATLLAAVAGFAGIAIMMASGARSGGFAGDLLACACVLTYSGLVIVVRKNPGMDLLPAIALTALASGLLALPFADFGQFSGRGWLVIAAFGTIQIGVGGLLIFRAVRLIPAAQAGLLGILNAAMAPLWVFAFLGEVPPFSTLLGGFVIVASAGSHLAWTIASSRRQMAFS